MKQMTKKAELFDKAIGDMWTAEQIYEVRPDYAIYHCAQSIEKTLKGIAVCCNKTYDHTISRFAEWDEVKQHFMEAQQLHNKIVKALKNI